MVDSTEKDNTNEEELELSDVPMEENEHHSSTGYNSEEDEDLEPKNEVYDKYKAIIQEDTEFINKRIFGDVIDKRQVVFNAEDAQDEPDEELDEKEQLRLLMDHLNPEQMSRYEYYRRSTVNRGGVKKIANTVLNQSVSNNVAIVLSGVSKIFVGEIIERARDIKKRSDKANYLIKLGEKKELNELLKQEMTKIKSLTNPSEVSFSQQRINILTQELERFDLRHINESGPLLPEHIREAWRLYQLESGTAPNGQWRGQGERDGLMFR